MQDEVRPLAQEVTALLIGSERSGLQGPTSITPSSRIAPRRLRRGRAVQERYLSLFPPAAEPGRIVDIGAAEERCWALLQQAGHDVMGVDLDLGMVEICTTKGLPAVVDDGIRFLSRTEPDSLKGSSAHRWSSTSSPRDGTTHRPRAPVAQNRGACWLSKRSIRGVPSVGQPLLR